MDIRVGILTAPKIRFEQFGNTFKVDDVRIGIGFHWDRCEDQVFEGRLEIIDNGDGTQTAVNIIDLEKYISSVISSEMSSNAPLELLKAHSVIARSWVLRAIGNTDHFGYDVCADDHCQRYEGIGRRSEKALRAVEETKGKVLEYQSVICDCRYHKCCGGKTDVFSTAWEDIDVPYLPSIVCPYCHKAASTKDFLTNLNDYDQPTQDFFMWQKTYEKDYLSRLIAERSAIDLGIIEYLEPLERGMSGRIKRLNVVGTKGEHVFEKELTIRKVLSINCLYSSWFDISSEGSKFILSGRGWGHGVGLCQIGACQMALEGASYSDILQFYYPGTAICSLTNLYRP